ncbi:hypothetical protein MMC18_008989 [Xylographa bjoerkii]|nr:hypothetical protein [Xylographa bjoerkii]
MPPKVKLTTPRDQVQPEFWAEEYSPTCLGMEQAQMRYEPISETITRSVKSVVAGFPAVEGDLPTAKRALPAHYHTRWLPTPISSDTTSAAPPGRHLPTVEEIVNYLSHAHPDQSPAGERQNLVFWVGVDGRNAKLEQASSFAEGRCPHRRWTLNQLIGNQYTEWMMPPGGPFQDTVSIWK